MAQEQTAEAAVQATARLDAAHKALLADKSIQFDLPRLVAPKPVKPPEWLEAIARFFSDHPDGIRAAFWVVVAALALAIGAIVLREMFGITWRWPWQARPDADDAGPASWRPDAGAARALLAEADALAGDGRYVEAVHLLLAKSIEDVARFRPGTVRPALTSRDIAGSGALPEAARAVFSGIARNVEVSWFGGGHLGDPEWQECRRSYERFALAETWA